MTVFLNYKTRLRRYDKMQEELRQRRLVRTYKCQHLDRIFLWWWNFILFAVFHPYEYLTISFAVFHPYEFLIISFAVFHPYEYLTILFKVFYPYEYLTIFKIKSVRSSSVTFKLIFEKITALYFPPHFLEEKSSR